MRRYLYLTLILFITIVSTSYSQTLVYYDPDGNLRRIVDISAEGSKLFSKVGLKFLVAADESSFNNVVKQYAPEYFILNSLVYHSRKREIGLEATSVFEKGKKFTYTKKVVTFQEGISIRNLEGKILASSFKDVSEIIPVEPRILKVPKDLDALLAMKFKQADVALVAESSIDVFKTISPFDFELLKFVYTSKEIFNPVLCYTIGRGSPSKIKEIEKIFTEPDAKQFLSLLMFDGISNDPKVLLRVK